VLSLIVFGEGHLHGILKAYDSYYKEVRTHLALDKGTPAFCRVQSAGNIAAFLHLGGLHHRYVRIQVFGKHGGDLPGQSARTTHDNV